MSTPGAARRILASSGSGDGDAEGGFGRSSRRDESIGRDTPDAHPDYDPGHELEALVDHVIGRLHRKHRAAPIASEPDPTTFECSRLTELAVAQDLTGALAFVDKVRAQGRSWAWIAQRLVAASAELLGESWADDRLSFAEVTVGAGLLQRLVRSFEAPMPDGSLKAADLVLLTCAPEEQHTLGLYVLARALEEDGWAVHLAPRMGPTELRRFIAEEAPVAVGLAVSDPRGVDFLPLLSAIRRVDVGAKPPPVLVGGPVDLTELSLQHSLTIAYDAEDALKLLRDLVV